MGDERRVNLVREKQDAIAVRLQGRFSGNLVRGLNIFLAVLHRSGDETMGLLLLP